MAYRIFISHSSHSDTARDFVKRLAAALQDANYEPKLDLKELKAGDVWNKELHEWMASCHAAILLLTPESIKSDWVLKEATILTWRQSLDAKFKLFPKIFAGVTEDTLKAAKFSPLVIRSVQKVAAETPEEIAREIAGVIGPIVGTETPLDEVAEALAFLLAPPRAGASTAEKLARKLGVDDTHWIPNTPADRAHAQLIAGRLVRGSLGAYSGVYELMQDLLETMTDEFARKALPHFAPHWVPATDACRLAEIAQRAGGWAIAMDGALLSRFTLEMYLLRAFPLRGERYQLPVPGGGSEAMLDELIEDIYRALEKHWNDDRVWVKKLLATRREPLFVVVPPEIFGAAGLGRLRAEFPALTFILDAGETPGTLPALAAAAKVEALDPVNLADEENAYLDYKRTAALFTR